MKKHLFAVLCFILTFFSVSALGAEVSADDPAYYSDLLHAYQNGKYGDGVYRLHQFGPMGGSWTITITVNDGEVSVTYETGNRVYARSLSAEEYQLLADHLRAWDIDSLPDSETHSIFDSSEYYYTHIYDDKVCYVYMGTLSSGEPASEAYRLTKKIFYGFVQTGDFEVIHPYGAKVLIPREKHYILDVWKDGEDFRVCVKTKNDPEWHSFRDGAVGEIVEAPENSDRQRVDEDEQYYFAESNIMGVTNDDETRRTPLLKFNNIPLSATGTWVDPENSTVYTVSAGDLLEVPFSLGEPYSEPINVRVNDTDVIFSEQTIVDNDTVLVWYNIENLLGAHCRTMRDIDANCIYRGNKLLILPYEADFMILMDAAGFGSIEEMDAELARSDITKKDYYRIIPLATTVPKNYIPLKEVCEIFGAEVELISEENLIDITIDNDNIEIMPENYISHLIDLIERRIKTSKKELPEAFMDFLTDDDEVFQLHIYEAFRGESSITITVNDSTATLTHTAGRRIRTRELSTEEYQQLVNHINIYGFDSLPDYINYGANDGVSYSYIHVSKNKTGNVNMFNPSLDKEESAAYALTAKIMEGFTRTGEFQVSHSSGARVLISKEEHYVEAVWKNGDDFRVCVRTADGPQWYSFSDGALGEPVDKPAVDRQKTEDGQYYYTTYTYMGVESEEGPTPLLVFSDISLSPTGTWIDEENSLIYSAVSGDLFEIPFSLGEVYVKPVNVYVNGSEVRFAEPNIRDNGHVHVWGNILIPIGAEIYSKVGNYASFACRGKKVLMFPPGADYIVEIDTTGFDSLDNLEADLAGGSITQKDYYRAIPIGTTVFRNYFPLRALCEAFGAEVIWNSDESRVDITIEESSEPNLSPVYVQGIMNILLG